MQIVYKEMTRDGAKFNLAKWNLIAEIKFVISRLSQGSKIKRNTYISQNMMAISFLSINSLYLRQQGSFPLPEIRDIDHT